MSLKRIFFFGILYKSLLLRYASHLDGEIEMCRKKRRIISAEDEGEVKKAGRIGREGSVLEQERRKGGRDVPLGQFRFVWGWGRKQGGTARSCASPTQ